MAEVWTSPWIRGEILLILRELLGLCWGLKQKSIVALRKAMPPMRASIQARGLACHWSVLQFLLRPVCASHLFDLWLREESRHPWPFDSFPSWEYPVRLCGDREQACKPHGVDHVAQREPRIPLFIGTASWQPTSAPSAHCDVL